VENVIIKFTADTTGLQPAVEQLKLIGKITDEDARKIDEINQSQAKYLNTLKATTKEAGNFGDEMASIKAEIQAGILEGVAEHFAEMGKEMEGAGKKSKTLKQELKELKTQIASGGLDAKQLSEATKRAAELTDHLGDVNQKIKALSSDTKRIDAVVEGFRGLAAGVAITQGAIGLLGGENEKVEKTLLKVQSAMALLTGIQEIANLATGEGILKTTYLSVAQRLAGKSATIMGVEISAAMAAATAGISLIIAGIAYLVVEMSSTEDSAKKIQERLGKMYEKDADVYANVLKKRQQLLQGSKDGELKALQIGYDQEFRERKRAQKETGQSQKSFDAETKVNIELFNKQKDDINTKYSDKEKKDLKEKEDEKLKIAAKAQEEANKIALENVGLTEELRKNYYKQLDIQIEFNKTSQEIDDMYAKISQDKRYQTSEEIFSEIQKQLKEQEDFAKNKAEIDIAQTEQLKKNTYKQLDIQKEYQKSSLEIDEIYSRIASEGRYQTSEEIYAQVEKELKDYEDLKKKQTDIDTKYLEEKAKKEEEYRQLAKQTALQMLENTASFAFSQIEQNLQQETDLKVAAAEEEQRKQLEGRELSASQQQAIERNTQREIGRIKTEAARKQRQADITQAAVNGAIAITRAYATMVDPISASIVAIGIGVTTGLQIAAIKNQPIPKFAKGTKGVEGHGTDTSDSILAYLSKGEMVIPTKTKESYFPALDLIFDKKVSPSIANELLLEASKGNYNISHDYNSPVYVNSSVAIDYDKLDRLFSKNKSTTNINMDESGFRKFLITENGKNEYLNKKFRK
jgi:hypothetical protein